MDDVTVSATAVSPVDLSNCDREPIHIPASVQPHAIMLVLSEPALIVQQASANAAAALGLPLEAILGAPLSRFVGLAELEIVQRVLREKSLEASAHYLPAMSFGAAAVAYEVSIHRYRGALILELENWPERHEVLDHEILSALKKMLSVSSSSESVAEFCQRTAEDVRGFIGFDRVMVYRFDPDLSGHVIAEAKRGDLESYLGLHYPASDIPKQARELFRLSKLRLIPDLAYAPVALVPALRTDTSQPLDMSFCVTRSVSPIHVEYLQNMGVRASMSISVVIDRQLWGLFSCHHYSPRYVPHAGRMACDFLAHALAVLLAGREQSDDFSYTKRLHENQRLLNHAIASERDFGTAVRDMDGATIGGIEADGAALLASGVVCLKGVTPGEAAVRNLGKFFAQTVPDEVWSTDRLDEALPAGGALIPTVSGLLAVRLSRDQTGYLFWFRSEVVQTVTWAGDVTKPVVAGPLGDRLTPRKSFALWKQEVRGRSRRWLDNEIMAAENVRHSYHELYAGQAQALVILNAEVASARDQAVQAMHAKDHFLATLSHELRTPLNPALLIASEEAANLTLPETARRNFAAIRDNIELEARLIDDLLDLSRISHGKVGLVRRALGLNAALQQALAILQSEFAAKPVALVLKLAPTEAVVNADVVRLLQVFWNVLKNAVKFTPVNGQVTVETEIDPARRWATVRISDTGIGLSPEELPKIFEPFAQGDHSRAGGSRRFGGLGLGLAITRSLLEAHAGRISVQSDGVNRGSTFTIELPLEADDTPILPLEPTGYRSSGSFGSVPAPPARKKILIVEDHAPSRAGLAMVLERRGYEALQAGTAAEGLALALAHDCFLIISDIGLPDGDGYTFMRELRVLRPKTHAIALSGYGMELDRRNAQDAGFSELLVKPINIQALDFAITQATEKIAAGRL